MGARPHVHWSLALSGLVGGHWTMASPNRPEIAGGTPFPWVHLVNAALLLGLWLWSWTVFPELPGQLPGRIGPSGDLEWDPAFWNWFSRPIAATALSLLNYGLAPVIGRAKNFNVPSSLPFTELLPEDQAHIRGLTIRFLQWMNVVLLGGFWLLQVGVREAALNPDPSSAPISVMGMVYLVVAPGLATVAFLVVITQAVRQAEQRAKEK